MKLIIYLTIFLGLTNAVLAQYEEGSFGTTGDRTVENTVKDGTLIIVGKFYDNTEGGYAGGGGSYYRARVEVSQILYGTCKSTLPKSYKVLPKSAKQPDGSYSQIPGRHDPPAEGTELIAIGKWYDANVEKRTNEQFSVLRYLYVTPENLERVTKLITQYHGEKKAGEPHQTYKAEAPITISQSTTATIARPSLADLLDETRAAYSQLYWLAGGVLVVLAGLWLRRRMRRP